MTNRELLMMLDGDLGERAVKNCIDSFGDTSFLDKKGYSINDTLLGAFSWFETKEGYSFWYDEFYELQSLGL